MKTSRERALRRESANNLLFTAIPFLPCQYISNHGASLSAFAEASADMSAALARMNMSATLAKVNMSTTLARVNMSATLAKVGHVLLNPGEGRAKTQSGSDPGD